jgi:hypothetical protein
MATDFGASDTMAKPFLDGEFIARVVRCSNAPRSRRRFSHSSALPSGPAARYLTAPPGIRHRAMPDAGPLAGTADIAFVFAGPVPTPDGTGRGATTGVS